MSVQSEELKERTIVFAINVLDLLTSFHKHHAERSSPISSQNVEHLSARTISLPAMRVRAESSSRSSAPSLKSPKRVCIGS